MWSKPQLYQKNRIHYITDKTFTSNLWYFFYRIGKEMYDGGVRSFDDKTVYSFLISRPQEKNKKSYFECYNDFGGYSIVEELIVECEKENKNEEFHLSEIQKYESLRAMQVEGLIDVTNDELVEKLCKCSLVQLKTYVQHKQGKIFSHINHGEVVEYDLLDPDLIQEVIEDMNEGESMGLPLFDAPRLNRKIKGWRDGDLAYLVFPSGVGKTSVATEKYILALLKSGEKGLVFANEENVKKFIRLLLATVASRILNTPVNREKMSEGNFEPETRQKLQKAREWLIKNRPDQIKFFDMKKYRLEDITSRIEMYRPLGYRKVIIDTFKPDTSKGDSARWEAFSQNATDLHNCIKESANNCGTLATVQLKIGKEYRYLDNSVIGKSPEVVEVAALVMLGRLMYEDEYPDVNKKFEIKAYNYKKCEMTNKWDTVQFFPDKKKEYLIIFISKNREGGKDEQILYEANYGINEWKEVAYVNVPRTANAK